MGEAMGPAWSALPCWSAVLVGYAGSTGVLGIPWPRGLGASRGLHVHPKASGYHVLGVRGAYMGRLGRDVLEILGRLGAGLVASCAELSRTLLGFLGRRRTPHTVRGLIGSSTEDSCARRRGTRR